MKKLLLIICCAFLLTACGDEIGEIDSVHIEYLNHDETKITCVEMEKEDVIKIDEILRDEKAITDKGIVFAEGGYRISVSTKGNKIELYPYCGSVATMKVGNDDNKYIYLDEEEQMKNIINKYILYNEYSGIWDWSKVGED